MRRLRILFFLIFLTTSINPKDLKLTILDKDLGIPLEMVQVSTSINDTIYFSDTNGSVVISDISDDLENIKIYAENIGYAPQKLLAKTSEKEIKIYLSLSETLEGNELVIEEEKKGDKTEEIGISNVMDGKSIKNASKTGPLEDVAGSIKLLPGVTYSGKTDSSISVRGGSPGELTAVIDGFTVKNIWHWKGAVSIFNPNFIDSVKLSSGIFSAKYGNATSGLLELTSIEPSDGFRASLLTSASTFEFFLKTQFNKNNMGLLIGGRITFYDLILLMTGMLSRDKDREILTTPYVRTAYQKWYYKPNNNVKLFLNSFFGNDGIKIKLYDRQKDDLTDVSTVTGVNYYNILTYVNTGIEVLATDSLLIKFIAGYELKYETYDVNITESGYNRYSNEFKEKYSFLLDFIGNPEGFKIDTYSSWIGNDILHSAQSRIDFDWAPTDKMIFSYGGGIFYDYYDYKETGKVWNIFFNENPDNQLSLPEYKPSSSIISQPIFSLIQYFTYFNFSLTLIRDILKLETGYRVDHNYILYQNQILHSYPTHNPRINFQISPPINKNKYLEKINISIGTGLFTKIDKALIIEALDSNYDNFELSIPYCLSSNLGMELLFPFNIKLKIEGYYKFYFNRFSLNPDTIKNGVGHSAGFEVLFQRNISRYIDGWISYSFIWTKLTDKSGALYYPSYHRFHNFNLIVNIKPFDWLTITNKLTVASGRPAPVFGEKIMFPTNIGDYQIAEMYARESNYSDDERMGAHIPYDIILTININIPHTPLLVEIYAGIEDLFYFLYKPEANYSVNKFSGEEYKSFDVNFDLGIPIANFGIKISF